MGDYRIEAFKKSVKNITKKWSTEIAKLDTELGKVDKELGELEELEEPDEDDEKKMAALRKKQAELRKKIQNCVASLRVNLTVLEVQKGAPKQELMELPRWVKEIIQKEGIPLGRGVSIAPDIEVDVKALTLEKLGVKITVEW